MHPSDEDLESHRTGRLAPNESSSIRTHLLACKICESKLQLLFQLSRWQNGTDRRERRHEVRIPADEAASVRVLQATFEPSECRVIEVSSGGLRLRVRDLLEPGTVVQVRLKHAIIMGEVRHCERIGAEYHAGVKVEDVVRIASKEES